MCLESSTSALKNLHQNRLGPEKIKIFLKCVVVGLICKVLRLYDVIVVAMWQKLISMAYLLSFCASFQTVSCYMNTGIRDSHNPHSFLRFIEYQFPFVNEISWNIWVNGLLCARVPNGANKHEPQHNNNYILYTTE